MITRLLFIAVLNITVLSNIQAHDSIPARDQILQLPDKAFASINHMAMGMNNKLIRQTKKSLFSLSKTEKKIYKELFKKDSIAASLLLKTPEINYSEFAEKIQNPIPYIQSKAKTYIPLLDSLMTSMSFLQKGNISKIPQLDKVKKSLDQLNSLQSKLDQIDQIEAILKERKQFLIVQLKTFGLPEEIGKYQKELNGYIAQFEAYKNILNEPDKAIRTSLTLLNKIPAFQEFFKKNSMLASIFRLPNNGNTIDPVVLAGLQTRASLQSNIQQQFGSQGLNLQQQTMGQMGGMQGYLQKITDKINVAGGSTGEISMPDYKANPNKSKSFLKRLELGGNLQTVRKTGFFPTTTDFGLSLGFNISEKYQVGYGMSYKMGWGDGFQKIQITHQGIGLRTFIDVRIKNTFFLSGGAELNYRSQINNIDQLKDYSAWQKSAIIGLTKKFQFNKKLKGNIQLLFDFLYAIQVPRTQPLLFRIGYGF